MYKRKFGGHKVAINIKTKGNIFFTRNIPFKRKATVMDELNYYNSTPERCDEKDVTCDEDDDESDLKSDDKTETQESLSISPALSQSPLEATVNITAAATQPNSQARSPEAMRDFAERCKFIPMRLTEDERRLLNVLENALEVCEYTDTVDVTYSHTGKSKQSRIISSLVDVLSISCGLLVRTALFSSSSSLFSSSSFLFSSILFSISTM